MDHDYKGHCEAGSSRKKTPLEQISEPEAEEQALEDQNVEERVTSQVEDLVLEVNEENLNVEWQLNPRPAEDHGLPVTNERAYHHARCTRRVDPLRIGVPLVATIVLASVIGYFAFRGK